MLRLSLFCILIISFLYNNSFARPQRAIQHTSAERTDRVPEIDGILDEGIWCKAPVVREFTQYDPDYSACPSQKTEVRILYDDRAIYIAARMYDSSPDSILKQLGQRNASLNADAFGIRFDTYNNQLDAYTFEVTASNVQRDFRLQDNTYDGIWDSAVNIDDKGWTVEMRIPYSSLRFPSTECQTWGMQIYRNIRRHREMNHWAIEERDASNNLVYWGQLSGLCNIQAPTQLALLPYLSLSANHYPFDSPGVSNLGGGFGGGMDLRYGINESFTFDMTLMPDFSQVQSDNVVKNLSAFETVHSEERPFFKENMDLFHRGGLFYSRRVGGRPIEYSSVNAKTHEEEMVISNPEQTVLLNAFKLSGRNKNGMAVGVFNAITDNTYAEIEDLDDNRRKVLTNPASNYSILVFDQAFANNSSAYLINTNVLRRGLYRHANVTGAGATFADYSNTYQIQLSGAFNQIYHKTDEENNRFEVETGKRYNASFGKTRGNFLFNLRRAAVDPEYNDNDLGLTHRQNEIQDRLTFNYNIHEPFWQMRNWRNRFLFQNQSRYNDYKDENMYVQFDTNGTTLNYTYVWHGLYFHPKDRTDYYEARTPSRLFVRPKGYGGWFGISSDYRKEFALDAQLNYNRIDAFENTNLSYRIAPRYRMSDQLMLIHSFRMQLNQNDVGFAGRDDSENVIFGYRDVTMVENVLSSDYIVTSDIYFSLRMRQYWTKGVYDSFHILGADGHIEQNEAPDFNKERDFNFNSFNIDLVFTWLFAPGSSFNLVWKNTILHEKNHAVNHYFDNFGLLKDAPQYNSISLKLLYHLDYQQLRGA